MYLEMHSKWRYRICICSVILGELESFRNYKGLSIIFPIILLHEKSLQFDWLRTVVFQLNLKYLHVKITNLLLVVVQTNNSMICK